MKAISYQPLKGIGINCSRPDVVSAFGKAAKEVLPDLTLIAYPNTGELYNPNSDLATYEEGFSKDIDFKTGWIGTP